MWNSARHARDNKYSLKNKMYNVVEALVFVYRSNG